MKNIISILMILILTALSGCHSASNNAAAGIPLFYAAAEIPADTYVEMSKTQITVTDNMFTDVNARIHESIRRRAQAEKADAVLVGDIGRVKCECMACRKNGNDGNGPHVCVEITLLKLKRR